MFYSVETLLINCSGYSCRLRLSPLGLLIKHNLDFLSLVSAVGLNAPLNGTPLISVHRVLFKVNCFVLELV